MSLAGKLRIEVVINVPADKFYEFFKVNVSHITNISPHFQEIEVHKNQDTHGHESIIVIWHYTVGMYINPSKCFPRGPLINYLSLYLWYFVICLDGKAEVFKERVELDDEKLMVTLIGLEGDVFNHYKIFKPAFQVVPKGPKHSLTILTLEYEKLDDGSPSPYKYLDLMVNLTKDIESYLK